MSLGDGPLAHVPAIGTLAAGAFLKARFHLDCPLHAATGLLCPACGTTRACLALGQGQVAMAVRDNVLFMGLLLLTGVWLTVPAVRRGLQRRHAAGDQLIYLGVAVLLAFTVVRNLPVLSELRPST